MHSTVKRIKPKRIDPWKWYIVDLYLIRKPLLLWNEFESGKAAREAMHNYLAGQTRYKIISGSHAIKHDLEFFWDLLLKKEKWPYKVVDWFAIFKYNYGKAVRRRQKRGFRVKERKRLKKLGLNKP